MFDEVVKKRKEFWARVKVTEIDKCWLWQLGVNRDGYGEFQFRDALGKKVNLRAHRVAYVLQFGDLAANIVLRHSCDTPACCNPWHLREGGHDDNVQDRVSRERSAIGVENGRAKLTEDDIPGIRARLGEGESLSSIARAFGVDHAAIRSIRDGKTWKHVL